MNLHRLASLALILTLAGTAQADPPRKKLQPSAPAPKPAVDFVPVPGNPTFLIENEPTGFEFEITNPKNAKTPLIIQAETRDQVTGDDCIVYRVSPEPILPGKKGRVRVVCKGFRHGDNYRRISQKIVVNVHPLGTRTLDVGGEVKPDSKADYQTADKQKVDEHLTSQVDTCGAKRKVKCPPGPRRKRKVCFYAERSFKGRMRDGLKHFCGDEFERVSYSGIGQISEYLDQMLANSCDVLDTVAYIEHGLTEGENASHGGQVIVGPRKDEKHPTLSQNLGFRDPDYDYLTGGDFEDLFGHGKYECMLTTRPRLIFGSCRLGTKCGGRLFMMATAHSLAPTRHLATLAPNAMASNGILFSAASRTKSKNGRDLVLRTENGKMEWDFQGVYEKLGGTYDNPKALSQYCAPECEEALKSVEKSENEIASHKCAKQDYRAAWQIKVAIAKEALQACVKAGKFDAAKKAYADVEAIPFLKAAGSSPADLENAIIAASEFRLLLENKDRLCEDPAAIADGNALKDLRTPSPETRRPTGKGQTSGRAN